MKYIVGFFLLCGFSSCDLPKDYFKELPPCVESSLNGDSWEQNRSKILDFLSSKKPSDFRYKFISFYDKKNETFMITSFRSKETCFDVHLRVPELGKLKGMKRTNGKSYPSELYKLEWIISKNQATTSVEYKDMHRIID